jgi:hypothetical protein
MDESALRLLQGGGYRKSFRVLVKRALSATVAQRNPAL